MRTTEAVSALILAAGLSRRMGEFKPLLPLRGKPLIVNTAASVLRGGAESAVVVTGYRAAEVEDALGHTFGAQVRCVRNVDYAASDMLRSAQIGAAALGPCGAFFLLPGDMPVIAPSTFERLLETRSRQHAAVIFPTLDGYRKHPPLIDAELIPEIIGFSGEGGLRGLWKRYEAQTLDVPVDDAGVWIDVDTPADYERCRQTYEEKREV